MHNSYIHSFIYTKAINYVCPAANSLFHIHSQQKDFSISTSGLDLGQIISSGQTDGFIRTCFHSSSALSLQLGIASGREVSGDVLHIHDACNDFVGNMKFSKIINMFNWSVSFLLACTSAVSDSDHFICAALIFLNHTVNSFPAIDVMFWLYVFSLLYGRGRCYTSSERVTNFWMKTQVKKKQQNKRSHASADAHTITLNELVYDCEVLAMLMDAIDCICVLIFFLNPIRR